ncbi:hypothetical protein DWUX_367 [Desulfovibrio diazotrophicus]|nr:hypothetical protein DWUX_367 [Desulfovibrio diazotrophicus]
MQSPGQFQSEIALLQPPVPGWAHKRRGRASFTAYFTGGIPREKQRKKQ